MLKFLLLLRLLWLPFATSSNKLFLRRTTSDLNDSGIARHRSLDEIHCKPNTAAYNTCRVSPSPFCTPHRSPEYCPTDTSFPLLINRRTALALASPNVALSHGHIFHLLEDKLKGYVYTTQILKLKAPMVLHCDSNYTDALMGGGFTPPASGGGFVIRATNQHSGKGVFVLPKGFGGPELLSGIDSMDATEIVVALDSVGAKHIIIEEFIVNEKGENALPTEYKMHVINGEVVSINVVYNRGDNDKCACWAEVDTEWNRLDDFGCFTPTGMMDDGTNVDDADSCYDIDFETGRKKNHPIKGFDICGKIPSEPLCLADLIAVAKIVGTAVGAYVRVDMFLDENNNVIVQEYTSNHMGGTRHCSAKVSDDATCVNACYLGELWNATGSTPYGGPSAESASRDAFLSLVDFHGDNDQSLCDSVKGKTYPDSGYTTTCPSIIIDPAPPIGSTEEPSSAPVAPPDTTCSIGSKKCGNVDRVNGKCCDTGDGVDHYLSFPDPACPQLSQVLWGLVDCRNPEGTYPLHKMCDTVDGQSGNPFTRKGLDKVVVDIDDADGCQTLVDFDDFEVRVGPDGKLHQNQTAFLMRCDDVVVAYGPGKSGWKCGSDVTKEGPGPDQNSAAR